MSNPIDRKVATALRSYTVLAIIALLVGAAVVPYAAGFVGSDDQEQYVAVVSVDETITDSTATDVVRELRALRANESVRAVVLRVSSPGGGAAASESMYLAVKRLAAEKPVYASVGGVAASGAFYTILPSDRIYATPSSVVGNVGVIATLPPEGLPNSVTTGPDKANGGMTRDEFRAGIESLKRAFVGAVMAERGDALTIDRTTVAEADAYNGGRAVETGYADEIGGLEAAIAGAASAAEISDYEVAYRDPAQPQFGLFGFGGDTTVVDHRGPYEFGSVETVRYLMLYGVPTDDVRVVRANATAATAEVGR
jgi:protease-4